jgi:hypothetical protein
MGYDGFPLNEFSWRFVPQRSQRGDASGQGWKAKAQDFCIEQA